MLGLVDNQVVSLQPVVTTGCSDEFTTAIENNVMTVYHGGWPIETGVSFFVMKGKKSKIDHRSGVFEIAPGENPIFRAVFAGQHVDLVP